MEQHYPLFYTFHFYFFGVVAIASALAFVTRKSPVAAALWLVNTMFSLSAIYVLLDAQFIGVMQVLVYAGAIMVVFLFVIMLLNLGHPSEIADVRGKWPVMVAGLIGIALLAELMAISGTKIAGRFQVPAGFAADELTKYGAVGSIARPLFNEYLLAFELTSILLLVAIAGAVVLGRRRDASAR
ncbi:MAG TPA: NADH-quinone oxidoreductase subunit J [Gemmatimonadaceae bacterium]|nr:NADH-quinone oxidoreductase subunit J [Gemmatimonadaceae bacterium]